MNEGIHLKRLKCPSCKQYSCYLTQDSLSCNNKACTFSETLYFPSSAEEPQKLSFNQGTYTTSTGKVSLSQEKLCFIIENYYTLHPEIPCQVCQGPTLQNSLTGLKNRCLNFPKCSVQNTLFNQSNEKKSYVFLDFETTGLSSETDHLTEFGAMKVDADGQEFLFQSLTNPGIDIPSKITSITGITTEMLEGAPGIGNILPAFLEFIEGATLVAHNAAFDMAWLIEKAKLCDLELDLNRPVICTLEWAKALQEPRCSLGILTKKYNIINQKAHRALADAIATKHLFFTLLEQKELRPTTKPLSAFKQKTMQGFSRSRSY